MEELTAIVLVKFMENLVDFYFQQYNEFITSVPRVATGFFRKCGASFLLFEVVFFPNVIIISYILSEVILELKLKKYLKTF